MPQGCAWGIFDKGGQKDHLGCLNLLTSTVLREAYKEARDGISISLNWPLDALRTPFFGRTGVTHDVISYAPQHGLHAFDDEVSFNTQCSSQWDSLVHFAHQPTALHYNNSQPSVEELGRPPWGKGKGKDDVDGEGSIPTLDHWHARGGLVGRGVLLDYRAYAAAKGVSYDCFSAHAIPVAVLEDIASFQGSTFKHGDIVFIRTGYTEDLGNATTPEEQDAMLNTGKAVGVEGSIESAKWFWNKHFAAVAGDAPVFECVPPKKEDGTYGTNSDLGAYCSPYTRV
jgi:hypothetical protein